MEHKLGNTEVTLKIVEPLITVPKPRSFQPSIGPQVTITAIPPIPVNPPAPTPTIPMITGPSQSKYIQLLNVIEELGRDIRPSYAGSRSSAERIKRGIVHARILVRECLVETERSAHQ